ncbi:MAG: matrixin family metalloprotease [Dehalococcoidia bacterium]
MIRLIRPFFSAALAALATGLVLLASTPATAQADEPPTNATAATAVQAKWQTPTVSIRSNWNAAICSGAYSNATGNPTPPLAPREMRSILGSVITQLNAELDGGLTLVDAGSGPAGKHCGQTDLTGGIFVGWSPLEHGIAGIAPPAWDNGTMVGAGVVINTILACDNTKEWVEFIMLHELMHALGIDHSDAPGSVMHEWAHCDATPTLQAADIAALQKHYPPALDARRAQGTASAAARTPTLSEISIGITDARITPKQLIPWLAAKGCDARTVAITVGGRSSIYLVGAPTFVNAGFPASLPAGTTYRYRCGS